MMFIQFHAEMDGSLPLLRTHHLVNNLEVALREVFHEAEILIHQDPVELYRDENGLHKEPGGIVFGGVRGG
jgi:ferrous-iron efflux pump FieF